VICSLDLIVLPRNLQCMMNACHCSQVLRLPEVVSSTALFCLGFTENRTSTSSSFFRYDIYLLDMLETTNLSRLGLAETFVHDGYVLCTLYTR